MQATPKSDAALKENVMWTSAMDSMCGVKLNIGKNYLIAGNVLNGKARLSACGYVSEWSKVTKRQRKGFRLLYRRGCNCDVSARFHN